MGDLGKSKGNTLIEGKLSDHIEKLKIEEAENFNVTEWRGKRIAIRNEAVRVFLLNFRGGFDHSFYCSRYGSKFPKIIDQNIFGETDG